MSDILAPKYVALACCAMALGFPLCFFGFRFPRVSLVTVVFLGGGAFTVLLTALAFPDLSSTSSTTPAVNWTAFVLGGVLCGCIALSFGRVGVFATGFCGGFTLLSLFVSTLGFNSSRAFQVLLVSASSLVWGCVACAYKKPGVITATSLVGATLLACAVAFCILMYTAASTSASDDNYYNDYYENSLAPAAWILYAVGLALLGLGTLIQFKVTGRGNRHERVESERELEDGRVGYDNLQTPTNGRSLI